MPLLGGLLVTLFGGLASFFVRFLAVRAAAVAAAIATYGVLTLALFGAASALASALTTVFPPIILTGVWLFVPDNAVACVAACIACDTLCALYRWNTGTLKIAAFTS